MCSHDCPHGGAMWGGQRGTITVVGHTPCHRSTSSWWGRFPAHTVRPPPCHCWPCFSSLAAGLPGLCFVCAVARFSLRVALSPDWGDTRGGKKGKLTTGSVVLRGLVSFPSPPATIYFPESSDSYSTHSAFSGRDRIECAYSILLRIRNLSITLKWFASLHWAWVSLNRYVDGSCFSIHWHSHL